MGSSLPLRTSMGGFVCQTAINMAGFSEQLCKNMVYRSVQTSLVALICLNTNSISDWTCMAVTEGWVQQMLKYSFPMCKFGTAIQIVMQYYHTNPVSETNTRHWANGGSPQPSACEESNMAHRMWWCQVSPISIFTTPPHLRSASTFLSFVYLGP